MLVYGSVGSTENALFHGVSAIMGTVGAYWKVSFDRNDRVDDAYALGHPGGSISGDSTIDQRHMECQPRTRTTCARSSPGRHGPARAGGRLRSGSIQTSLRWIGASLRCATPGAAGKPSSGSSSSATDAESCARSTSAAPSALSTPATEPTSGASWGSWETPSERHRQPCDAPAKVPAGIETSQPRRPCGKPRLTDGRAISRRGTPTRIPSARDASRRDRCTRRRPRPCS